MAASALKDPSLAWLALGEVGRSDHEGLLQSLPALMKLVKQPSLDLSECWDGVGLQDRAMRGWAEMALGSSPSKMPFSEPPHPWEGPALALLKRTKSGWGASPAVRAQTLDEVLASESWHVLKAWCQQSDRPSWEAILAHPVGDRGSLLAQMDEQPSIALALVEAGLPLTWTTQQGENLLFFLPNAPSVARRLIAQGMVASHTNRAGKNAAEVFAQTKVVRRSADLATWIRLCGAGKDAKIAFDLAKEGKLTKFKAVVKDPLAWHWRPTAKGPSLNLLDVATGNVLDWLVAHKDIRRFPLESRLVQVMFTYNPKDIKALANVKELKGIGALIDDWPKIGRSEDYEYWLGDRAGSLAKNVGIQADAQWHQRVLTSLWGWLNAKPDRWLKAASPLDSRNLHEVCQALMPIRLNDRERLSFGSVGMLLKCREPSVVRYGTWHHKLMMGAWATAVAWEKPGGDSELFNRVIHKNLPERFMTLARKAFAHGVSLNASDWAPFLAQAGNLKGDHNPILMALAEIRRLEICQHPASVRSTRRARA
jgi:hypothetical protein